MYKWRLMLTISSRRARPGVVRVTGLLQLRTQNKLVHRTDKVAAGLPNRKGDCLLHRRIQNHAIMASGGIARNGWTRVATTLFGDLNRKLNDFSNGKGLVNDEPPANGPNGVGLRPKH